MSAFLPGRRAAKAYLCLKRRFAGVRAQVNPSFEFSASAPPDLYFLDAIRCSLAKTGEVRCLDSRDHHEVSDDRVERCRTTAQEF